MLMNWGIAILDAGTNDCGIGISNSSRFL